jgi:hypothetical protein
MGNVLALSTSTLAVLVRPIVGFSVSSNEEMLAV